jgi:acetolactate synthase I/III small subunit
MKHTISCLAYNRPGVLAEIARSFAEEGINIYSLAAGEVEEEDKSRMTIVVEADSGTVTRAKERLGKINDVIKLRDFEEGELIAMELLMVKIRLKPQNIPQILQIAELVGAQVIAVSDAAMVLTLAAEEKKINGTIRMLKPLCIVELSRSGTLAVSGRDQ